MGHVPAPPYSNRGAQNTDETYLSASVDWFQCTFRNADLDVLIDDILRLQMRLFKSTFTTYFGYEYGVQYNNIMIFYNEDREHYHVYMTGQGCRAFEYYLETDNSDWSKFFKKIYDQEDLEVNITRLDICIDDRKLYLSIPQLLRKVKRSECISKFKVANVNQSISIVDGANKGHTLYFGSPQSRVRFRFYEKNYEQAHRLQKDVSEIGDWNRYECQMRDKQANNCAKQIAEHGNIEYVVKGVMFYYIRFIVDKKSWKGVNRSRQDIYKPYKNFLDGAEKLKITNQPELKSIDDKITWFKQQLSNTLLMIQKADEMATQQGLKENTDYLQDILNSGMENPTNDNLIEHHLMGLKQKVMKFGGTDE